MNTLPTRRLTMRPPAPPSLAGTLLRGTLGRVSGWLLTRVFRLDHGLGG
ncbi:MAG: hypothetical protein R3F39_07735 [Myxococcota bacterium]